MFLKLRKTEEAAIIYRRQKEYKASLTLILDLLKITLDNIIPMLSGVKNWLVLQLLMDYFVWQIITISFFS